MAVEIEGGTYCGGRHVRPDGYRKDCEKYNTAASMGWLVFRFTSDMVRNGNAVNFMERVLNENLRD